jgi:hypothetical protein
MDINVQRALNDKLYDKRKVGALEYVLFFLLQYTVVQTDRGRVSLGIITHTG